jgi:RNA polymerase sigma factor (sigma-70 family)
MRDYRLRSDASLLNAAREGDGPAYGEFYRRHRPIVLSLLRRRGCGTDVAADLMAETFAAALGATLDSDRAIPAEPAAWLVTIALNKLRDSARRGRVEQEARKRLALEPLAVDDDDLRMIDEMVDATDVTARLSELLPAAQLEAIQAKVVDELEYPDIAQALQCSEAVVRKRVSRALNTLRQVMEKPR